MFFFNMHHPFVLIYLSSHLLSVLIVLDMPPLVALQTYQVQREVIHKLYVFDSMWHTYVSRGYKFMADWIYCHKNAVCHAYTYKWVCGACREIVVVRVTSVDALWEKSSRRSCYYITPSCGQSLIRVVTDLNACHIHTYVYIYSHLLPWNKSFMYVLLHFYLRYGEVYIQFWKFKVLFTTSTANTVIALALTNLLYFWVLHNYTSWDVKTTFSNLQNNLVVF